MSRKLLGGNVLCFVCAVVAFLRASTVALTLVAAVLCRSFRIATGFLARAGRRQLANSLGAPWQPVLAPIAPQPRGCWLMRRGESLRKTFPPCHLSRAAPPRAVAVP